MTKKNRYGRKKILNAKWREKKILEMSQELVLMILKNILLKREYAKEFQSSTHEY